MEKKQLIEQIKQVRAELVMHSKYYRKSSDTGKIIANFIDSFLVDYDEHFSFKSSGGQ